MKCMDSDVRVTYVLSGRSDREGSNYENSQEERQMDIKTKLSNPAIINKKLDPGQGYLTPPMSHSTQVSTYLMVNFLSHARL